MNKNLHKKSKKELGQLLASGIKGDEYKRVLQIYKFKNDEPILNIKYNSKNDMINRIVRTYPPTLGDIMKKRLATCKKKKIKKILEKRK